MRQQWRRSSTCWAPYVLFEWSSKIACVSITILITILLAVGVLASFDGPVVTHDYENENIAYVEKATRNKSLSRTANKTL